MNVQAVQHMPKFSVLLLSQEEVKKYWGNVEPLLQKGEKYWIDYYTYQDLFDKCMSGEMQLWIGVKGSRIPLMMLTALITYPRSIWLRYVYVGGEQLKAVLYYRPKAQSWARAHGAVGEEIIGRPGWAKVFPDLVGPKHWVFLKKKFEGLE